jgi:hypothetical protein
VEIPCHAWRLSYDEFDHLQSLGKPERVSGCQVCKQGEQYGLSSGEVSCACKVAGFIAEPTDLRFPSQLVERKDDESDESSERNPIPHIREFAVFAARFSSLRSG